MSRYIDAELLPNLFDKEYKYTCELIKNGESHLDNLAEGFTEAHMVVAKVPTADVAEVKHGEWLISEYEYYDCSVCGESYFNGCDSTSEAKRRLEIHQDVYDYCPYCGAKMNLKEE